MISRINPDARETGLESSCAGAASLRNVGRVTAICTYTKKRHTNFMRCQKLPIHSNGSALTCRKRESCRWVFGYVTTPTSFRVFFNLDLSLGEYPTPARVKLRVVTEPEIFTQRC
ncbi:hypothetical protein EVAR_14998_1 [Eumeta japonica]|uniref:Uncharacterized protein n=1 Tax=Eumeta variegata TaxID=151549 RepID=A0A4C1X9U1_EUMVA|nr:hypothetical protein EVAR_14998_1 [Eumeta japonica]